MLQQRQLTQGDEEKILVINSGSSSIKFQLLEMGDESVLASGLVERIGEKEGFIKCTLLPGTDNNRVIKRQKFVADHKSGMRVEVEILTDLEAGVISDGTDISGVGHRVVHGGENFHRPTLIINEELAIGRDVKSLLAK